MNITPFHDNETARAQRNLTTTQKRTNYYTKEGVLVNNFIKDNSTDTCINLDDTVDTLIISDRVKLPQKLEEDKLPKEKSLLPISAASLAVMGLFAGVTAFISHNTKIATQMAKNMVKEKWLPTLTRNISINDETSQAIFQMVTNPNRKTIIAGLGVLSLTATAFMGKTFFDGFKEIWVKKREADIQKNLQEKLIDVETQSFSGKIQIIRNTLSDKAKELNKYISEEDEPILPNFGKSTQIAFMGTNQSRQQANNKKNNPVAYFLMGAATVGGIIGLSYMSLMNLSRSRGHLKDYTEFTESIISKVVKNSTETTRKQDSENLLILFQSIDAAPETVKRLMQGIKWEKPEVIEEFINNTITKIQTSAVKVNSHIGGDGTPKPAFSSFVDDYRAFLYNWLLDTDNAQFRQLFFGMTGAAAISYGGKLAGDAIKEVQVKKINAQTELDLQKRLVSTELRNFKSKKDAAIQPLMDEFYKQVQNGKPKEQLKTMADNILFEVKNGPPFVYS